MSDIPPLLRWTRFASDPHGTGPEKRSAQIKALCSEAGYSIEDLDANGTFSRARIWWAGIQARRRFGALASVDRAGAGLLGYRTLLYRRALDAHRGTRVLLWETTYDTVLPTLAKAAGYHVIALPHNLESLVTEAAFAQSTYDPSVDLAAEVRRLALADALFTISKEERWFLEARGLSPHYLPYFPDAALAHECAAIRKTRLDRTNAQGAVTGPLLLLGSAFNPATARGMSAQLQWLADGPARPEIIVAGPQTETALSAHAAPHVRIRGRVDRATLVEIMGQCSALLIHTTGGAGAVTRIPEALLAGIPVVANANAARDQYGVAGVHVYDSPSEFRELVRAPLPIPPPPSAPVLAITRFQTEISRLVTASQS